MHFFKVSCCSFMLFSYALVAHAEAPYIDPADDEKHSVAGLLVIKDGHILYERYGLGNTEDSRWISYSVAKSVVSMLFGAAIQDGYIKSVDEKVTEYLPRLKGSSYDQSSIANLLQMASGVQWNEDYADPEFDASWNLTEPGGGEFGGCCINATLRDYGRIGLFAMANGRLSDGAWESAMFEAITEATR